jgi:hypothetical protein
MTVEEIIAALDLPAGSRVDQRVPKKLLVENGAPTAGDKRQINEGIEELLWLAALKPTTIGVPEYRDEAREYLEIAVLQLVLREGAKATRLVELVHRAVPYPVLLLTEQKDQLALSAAQKRWSQGEAGKTVLDGEIVSARFDESANPELIPSFLDALKLNQQSRVNLRALYGGWIDSALAWNAAEITLRFTLGDGLDSSGREEALREFGRLEAEAARLRAAAKKEKQIAKRVELNLELKRVEGQLAITKEKL